MCQSCLYEKAAGLTSNCEVDRIQASNVVPVPEQTLAGAPPVTRQRRAATRTQALTDADILAPIILEVFGIKV